MSDMIEATKEHPHPLDAYETAKPEEPIFTLQGGDPLASSLVRMWAYLARVRCGARGDASWVSAPIMVAELNSIAHDEDAVKELLSRATQAEQVSWYMDGYRRGDESTAEQVARMNDLDKLDIYDIRRRCTSMISTFFSNLEEFREQLLAHNFLTEETDNTMREAVSTLRSVMHDIEIRRGN